MPLTIRPKLMSLYQSVKASFWLIPLCMLVSALILAPTIVELDLQLAANAEDGLWPGFRLSVAGAQEILSAIAGSMITVASLVFSMTLIALSLVAQQLGPRILQIFMEDRPTQLMLGLFIATFLFAMIVLGSIGYGSGDKFIPKISVVVATTLAILAFGAVILFVHHIARHIQADVVIFQTAKKLRTATEALSKNSDDDAERVDKTAFEKIQSEFGQNASEIRLSNPSGYVQYVNDEVALRLAEKHDLKIAFQCRPGHFMLKGRPLMTVARAGSIDEDLACELEELVTLGPHRTRGQHVEFEMLALVEIALRAVSKGINDPFTAISCIDWLSEGLAKLMKRYPDYRIGCDEEGRIRVILYPQTFEHYVNETFNPIREAAKDIPMVQERLRLALTELKAIAPHEAQKRVLHAHLAKLEDTEPHQIGASS